MFSNNGIIKYIWLLRSDVYPCEYMDKWEEFNETSSPEKDDFYSNLNMESITEADYNHPKRISQPTNIGPKDVPRTSPSSVLRMPLKILFDHPGDVESDVLWKTLLRSTSEDLQKTSSGHCWVFCSMSLNFILLLSKNLFDWPSLYKCNVKSKGVFKTQSNFYDGAFC